MDSWWCLVIAICVCLSALPSYGEIKYFCESGYFKYLKTMEVVWVGSAVVAGIAMALMLVETSDQPIRMVYLSLLVWSLGLCALVHMGDERWKRRERETLMVESRVLGIPTKPFHSKTGRDFVRFYTAPEPVIHVAIGSWQSQSAPIVLGIPPKPPLPNGDLSFKMLSYHVNNFKSQIKLVVEKEGIRVTGDIWRRMFPYFSVGRLIDACEVVESLEEHYTIHSPDTPFKIENLGSPCFYVAFTPPQKLDPGCLRMVVYAKVVVPGWNKHKTHVVRITSDNLLSQKKENQQEAGQQLIKRETFEVNYGDEKVSNFAVNHVDELFSLQRMRVLKAIEEKLVPGGILSDLCELVATYAGLHEFYGRGHTL